MTTHLVLGGPGCGKTTRLLDIVAEEMNAGVASNEIAFVAFTTAAAKEAKARAVRDFSLHADRDLPWFRTIHSLAYNQLGIMRDEVMAKQDWFDFSKVVGMTITGRTFQDDTVSLGDRFVQLVDFARTSEQDLHDTWKKWGVDTDWYALERFAAAYANFKEERGKVDFTDMLVGYAQEGKAIPQVKVAVIDEAQDLTALQWRVVTQAFGDVERTYIAGDDDQAIYHWAGADVERFLNLGAEREVLPISHRLAAPIFELTQRIAHRITHRYQKPFESAGHPGLVRHYRSAEQVDIAGTDGSWLVLARNRYMLRELEEEVRRLGLLYMHHATTSVKPTHLSAIYGWEAWRKGRLATASQVKAIFKFFPKRPRGPRIEAGKEYAAEAFELQPTAIWHEALVGIPVADRWYYVACLRRGEKLRGVTPRIRLDTIHGVKGAEADHVLLMTDMSARTRQHFREDPDSEHRVFYVGASRARQSLHIVEPQTVNNYPL